MTKLFVLFVHGGRSTLRMAMKNIVKKPSTIVIGVNYEKGVIDIIGCPIVTELISKKADWFIENPKDNMGLYKQLLRKIAACYSIPRAKTCFFSEGNLGVLSGEVLEREVVDLLNELQPRFAMLPTGTPECCRFINYWITYHGFPAYELKKTFIHDENYLPTDELTEEKIRKWNQIAAERRLTCMPPSVATFTKTLSHLVLADVFDTMDNLSDEVVRASKKLEFVEETRRLSREFSLLDVVDEEGNTAHELFMLTKRRHRESMLEDSKDDSLIYNLTTPTTRRFPQDCFSSEEYAVESIPLSVRTENVTPSELSDDKSSLDENTVQQKSFGLLFTVNEEVSNTQEEPAKDNIYGFADMIGPVIEENRYRKEVVERDSSSSFIVDRPIVKKTGSVKKKGSWWSIFSCCTDESSVAVEAHSKDANIEFGDSLDKQSESTERPFGSLSNALTKF